MSEPFFKIRPTKRSNPEARTTLDSLHQNQISKLLEKKQGVDDIKQQVEDIQNDISNCVNVIERNQKQNRHRELIKEIQSIEDEKDIYNYFLETGDILYQYYDIQEKIQQGVESLFASRPAVKPGSVMAALQEAAKKDNPNEEPEKETIKVLKGENLQRDKLLDKYLQKVDPGHARNSTYEAESAFGVCDECSAEMIFSSNEALFNCAVCGNQEFVLMDSDKPSYKDPPREVSYYAYKRINHFNEWLAQFQAKECTDIPQEIYDQILVELKKERITHLDNLKPAKIREILKKIKANKYYEHVPHITNRLNGKNAPVMNREIEEKLRYMFKEIQPSFQKHCPKGRSNFLSYSYVLYKFCELLQLDDYLPNFPLLKNRDKLYTQDKIWQKICEDLGWQFIRSI
jgi:L-rhamnose mutarotase